MNTQSNAMPESPSESQVMAPAVIPASGRMYWSVRRELWEHRSVYIAPLAAAAIFLFGFLISTVHLPRQVRAALVDPAHLKELGAPYDYAAGAIMLVAAVVQLFYCLDALQGERRDRSILFWKSLPVSDLTAVLAKASIPIVVLPLLSFVVVVITQTVMLLLSTFVVTARGLSAAPLWSQLSLFQTLLMLLYHLVTVHMLWYAPIYGWLLLISAWARRAALLWAVLPPLGIGILERLVFGTTHFAAWMQYRFSAGMEAVTSPGTLPMDPMTHLTPGNFLSTPGLWLGWLALAIFLAAAARIRRYREPI